MAASKTGAFRLSAESIKSLEEYLKKILESHKQFSDLQNKAERIDIAYFMYKAMTQQSETSQPAAGVDAGLECCGAVGDVDVPVVISQVDSFVGYLAEVFCSGYPLFPVVSTPEQRVQAEQLESILDNHATLGGYARQFVRAFRNGIKYNFMPIEHSWEPVDQYGVVSDMLKPTESSRLEMKSQSITKVRSLNVYNTVWDFRVEPVDVCYAGEFAGHIELEPRIPLKRFINRYSQSGNLYNLDVILSSTFDPQTGYYKDNPQVNAFVQSIRSKSGSKFDWTAWLNAMPQQARTKRSVAAGLYEKFTCYARIIPTEHRIINVPKPNSPQIWKFIMLNASKILYAAPVFTTYDTLPIMIGQPLEDGFDIQTKSIGEGQIPIQEAATTLFNIRFNAARRAVSDRALYDQDMISPDDINAPAAAPKIPVRLIGLNGQKTLESAYKQIPFDPRGTDSVIQDARNVLEFGDILSGLNRPNQGRFQKGNKSVREWEDTMAGSDNRLRLPALMIEYQVMMPLKEQLKLNIFQNKVTGTFQNYNTGNVYKLTQEDMTKLQEAILSFRLADGFTPKAKMASSDFLMNLLQLIGQSQILQQTWGPALPQMVAHLAQLGGVRGMEQYLPQTQNTTPQQGVPANGQGAPGPTAPAA